MFVSNKFVLQAKLHENVTPQNKKSIKTKKQFEG